MQFIKKTSSTTSFIRLAVKCVLILVLLVVAVFLLNKIDFPTPKKEIEKIISNENFKIVK
tara:strand:- start:2107 stop:2286 length:180 start_codon:yes stop_codon:yes gene_type:complete